MKTLTIKTSIYTLFVGLFVLIGSNAQGQEGSYGTCNSDNNTVPTPSCNPESAEIIWFTGTAHCVGNFGVSSECWDTYVPVIRHSEPVTWSHDLVRHWASWDGIEGEWYFAPFSDPAPCISKQGEGEDEGPLGPHQEYEIFLCASYSIGADSQSGALGQGCSELDL